MTQTYTVKARIHHGSKSLDLTIPAEIVRSMRVNPGDIFKITIEESGQLRIIYERIFEDV